MLIRITSTSGTTSEALNRAEHGHGRGQHAVAEEKREAGDGADADNRLDAPSDAGRTMGQRRQRQHAAFAIVVGAHDQENIFKGHHAHQCPEDQRQAAHDRKGMWDGAAGRDRRLADRIERTGADIAEHHAECAQGQRGLTFPGLVVDGVHMRCERRRVVGGERIGVRGRSCCVVDIVHGRLWPDDIREPNAKLTTPVCKRPLLSAIGVPRRAQEGADIMPVAVRVKEGRGRMAQLRLSR
jgi:hypothetical protein